MVKPCHTRWIMRISHVSAELMSAGSTEGPAFTFRGAAVDTARWRRISSIGPRTASANRPVQRRLGSSYGDLCRGSGTGVDSYWLAISSDGYAIMVHMPMTPLS